MSAAADDSVDLIAIDGDSKSSSAWHAETGSLAPSDGTRHRLVSHRHQAAPLDREFFAFRDDAGCGKFWSDDHPQPVRPVGKIRHHLIDFVERQNGDSRAGCAI